VEDSGIRVYEAMVLGCKVITLFRLEPIWWIGPLCLELMFVVLVEAQGEGAEVH
jgi:hypothetical protein